MTNESHRPADAAERRRKAEETARNRAGQSPDNLTAMSPEELRQAIHELRVHQIELEMQNEELRRTQAERDAERARHFDLFDGAPMGYVTISEPGLILQANLTAGTLLGVARGALLEQPISRFILPEDNDIYYLHRKKLLETGEPQDCDLRMLRQDGTQFWAHLAASAAQGDDGASPVADFRGSPVCRVVMSDITDRKRGEEVLAFLARTSSGTGDEPFFDALARYLADSLQMDFVCIDRLEGDGLFARTVAVWCDGKFEDNVTYALKDTPCGVVVGQTVCCFPASVCQFFPRDQVLQDLRAESYVGVTLWSHTGQPIGLIAVIGRLPLANRSLAEATLKLVAVRAAAELERLDAEAALRESEAMLRRAQEITHIGHFRFNVATGAVEGSDELFRIFGLTRQEFQFSDFTAAIRPDQRGYVVSTIQRAIAERTRYNIEHYLQPSAGTLKYVNAIGEVVAPSSTDQPVLVGTVQDITERKRAEEQLEKELLMRMALLDNIPGCIALIVKKGTREIVASNKAGREIGAVPGQMCFKTCAMRDDHCPFCLAPQMWATGQLQQIEVEYRGTWFEGKWAPLSEDLYVHYIFDITARKRAEEEKAALEGQLQQARKMESVGRLAGGVAHDFNNMLGVILGHTELALEQVDPAQPLHADLTGIRKAATRSADLTRQLLAFARKQTIAPTVLDLNETVESMLTMLRRLIGEDIDLAWLPGKNLWPIKVDASQIDQMLANLCVNARDAIAGVGKVTIETETAAFDEAYCANHPGFAPGEYVRLAVSDDGCGMDKDTLASIFEPFFTTKVVGKGTGLGLATVYGIVKQNGGFITAQSEPGQGTTFTIYLPRHAGKARQARTKGAAGPALRGHETILLVEDEPAILDLTTRMLERQGYTVLAASTPGEAIRLAREYSGEIHLLMTDVVMPGMNGRDLARNLLSVYPRLALLFMSGYTADVIAHHGVLDDGVCFIQKPFSIDDLAAKVREVLDRQ